MRLLIGAMLVPEMCIWLAETRKFEFCRDAYRSWTWCSNVVLTWMKKIGYTSLLFLCVGDYSWIVSWTEFFFYLWIRSQLLAEDFSYCAFIETFAIGSQNWFYQEWIDFGFFVCGKCIVSSLSYLHGIKFARIA